jgi:hypothetical protein
MIQRRVTRRRNTCVLPSHFPKLKLCLFTCRINSLGVVKVCGSRCSHAPILPSLLLDERQWQAIEEDCPLILQTHYSSAQLHSKICWHSSIFVPSAPSLLPRMLARCTPHFASVRARAFLLHQRFSSIPTPTSPPRGGSEANKADVGSTVASQETDIINRIALSEHTIVRGLGFRS